MVRREVGLLLHLVRWAIREDEIEIAPQVKLCRTRGSRVGQLYEELCRNAGLEDGDPLSFETCVLIGATHPEINCSDVRTYESPLIRLANVIALVLQEPIRLSRIIETKDGFKRCTYTEIMHRYGEMTNSVFCSNAALALSAEVVVDIDRAWGLAENYWIDNPAGSRLVTALASFELACRGATFREWSLNLGTSLALLFPSMHGEERYENLASVFCSSFLTAKIRQFAEMHRNLIEGSLAASDLSCLPIFTVYRITALLLKTVLLDEKLAKDSDEGVLRPERVVSPKIAESCADGILRTIGIKDE